MRKKYVIAGIFGLLLMGAAFSRQAWTAEELQAVMLGNNNEIRQLRTEKEQYDLDVQKAKAQKIPTVDFKMTYNYITNPLEAIVLPAGLNTYTDPATGAEILVPPEDIMIYEGMDNNYYLFNVTVTQPLYTWGKINKGIDIYKLLAQVGDLAIASKEQELEVTLTILLKSMICVEEIKAILIEEEQIATRLTELSEEGFKNGFIVYEDYLDVKIRVMEINTSLTELLQQENELITQIRYLTGVDELEPELLLLDDLDIEPDHFIVPLADSLKQKARDHNHQLKMLEHLEKISDLRYAISRAERNFVPDLGLQMRIGYGGSRFPFVETGWYGADRNNMIFSLGISTTLFDGGKNKYTAKSQSLEVSRNVYQYRQALSGIDKNIDNTLMNLKLNRARIEYDRLKIENSREQAKLKQTQFQNGSGDESDWIIAEIDQKNKKIELYKETILFFKNFHSLELVGN